MNNMIGMLAGMNRYTSARYSAIVQYSQAQPKSVKTDGRGVEGPCQS